MVNNNISKNAVSDGNNDSNIYLWYNGQDGIWLK
jgi:hypothetical protein